MESSLKAEMCHTLATRLPFTPPFFAAPVSASAPALKYNGWILSGQPRPRLLFLLGDFPPPLGSLHFCTFFLGSFWFRHCRRCWCLLRWQRPEAEAAFVVQIVVFGSPQSFLFFFYYKLFPFARVLVSSFAARVCVCVCVCVFCVENKDKLVNFPQPLLCSHQSMPGSGNGLGWAYASLLFPCPLSWLSLLASSTLLFFSFSRGLKEQKQRDWAKIVSVFSRSTH